MSRSGDFRRVGRPARLALSLGLAMAGSAGSATAQDGTPVAPTRGVYRVPIGPVTSPVPRSALPAEGAPVVVEPVVEGEPEANPGLPDGIQVVRFAGPEGLKVEVLGPASEPVPVGDGKGLGTFGLKVGVGYKLRLSNLPDRPGVELYPTIEVVGHLHRPAKIDPGKYPIRVVFGVEDLVDAADSGRLVTQVVYLEDPEQALPIKLDKDEPPIVTLNPAEEPLKVASALGRVMAILRIGARRPTQAELTAPIGDGLAGTPCPFTTTEGSRCGLPCGPVRGTPPPAGRPWLPKDEYLCDGGDHAMPVHFGGNGGLAGLDPRDAVVIFRDKDRPRVLPTNTVCLYAPRFATVRVVSGANENLIVQGPRLSEQLERQATANGQQGPKRLAQNAAAETGRHRARASGLAGRTFAGEHTELQVLSGYNTLVGVRGGVGVQGLGRVDKQVRALGNRSTTGPVLLNRPEAVVMTGIVEGAGQTVMTWTPNETVGVEPPAKRPGISIIKQVSADQAESGDEVTFTIRYKNMGNTPIHAVSLVDSLMPRLEYIAGSAQGPARTVFTAAPNAGGSLELRWDLPGELSPGSEGYVEFRAVVR